MLRQYVKGKFTMWLLVVSLAVLLSGCAGCPGGNNARRMFFDKQTGVIAEFFFTPVQLVLPKRDDTKVLEGNRRLERRIEEAEKARREGKLVVPPIPFFRPSHFQMHGFGASGKRVPSEEGAKILNFLVNQGYLKVVTFRDQRYYLYTDKIKGHLKEFQIGKEIFPGKALRVARRVLRSIDYSHQWEGGIDWEGMPVWAITFSYTLEPLFPGLPRVNKVFEGRAKAVHDLRTGRWEWVEMELPLGCSAGFSEALEIIRLLPSP